MACSCESQFHKSSYEVQSTTGFTFQSKSFLIPNHYITWQIKQRFFSSLLQTHYFLAIGNVVKFLFTPFTLSFHLFFFLCCHSNCNLLWFSLFFLRQLLLLSFPLQPVSAFLFIRSKPFTQLFPVIQLCSQLVTTCFRLPLLRKFLHVVCWWFFCF